MLMSLVVERDSLSNTYGVHLLTTKRQTTIRAMSNNAQDSLDTEISYWLGAFSLSTYIGRIKPLAHTQTNTGVNFVGLVNRF